MRVDVQLMFWLVAVTVFVISGIAVAFAVVELEVASTLKYLIAAGFTILFLVGLNLFQAMTTRTQAAALAEYLTNDLSEQIDLFSELFNNSPVPYILINRDGLVTLANTAASRLYGVAVGELSGKEILSTLDEDENIHISMIPSRLRSGTFVNDEEVKVMRSDGVERWVLLSAFPYGAKGQGLITLVDITKQKEIDRAKSEFVSLASHQLRTPISAMRWNSELLASPKIGELNDKQTQYLAKMDRSLEKMNILVSDFLDASHLEMGTFATEIKQLALDPFLDDIYDEFIERVHKKNITFTRHTSHQYSVSTDEHLLHMVVSNLISNAVKYTPENGAVTVSCEVSGDQIVFEITDTGMGIPANDQEQLFSKFFRAENAKAEVSEGTGLGLYIVKEAVDMLGGTIAFTSEAEKGTVFVVSLPRV